MTRLALLLALLASPAAAAGLSGRAEVVDGDTISIEDVADNVRLNRIDTPESGQVCLGAAGERYLCGSRAADALALLIGRNGRVTCTTEGKDGYERWLGMCRANGVDLNGEMVRLGWALEYRKYSDGRFEDEEAEAKAAGRGMWAGEFVPPWDWRRGERLASERAASGQPAGCDIKGNISSSGRIYHMPGSRHYGRTRIDESAGERWFCSPAEAEAAGWRAARG